MCLPNSCLIRTTQGQIALIKMIRCDHKYPVDDQQGQADPVDDPSEDDEQDQADEDNPTL